MSNSTFSQKGPVILDEDNMTSNSATAVPTQQSTKAYVDTNIQIVSMIYGKMYPFTFGGFSI